MAVVAALQGQTPAFRRRIHLRRQSLLMATILGLSLAAGLGGMATTPAAAQQSYRYNQLPPRPPKPARPQTNDGQMLVQATEVNYDYNNSRVAAVGSVQIYYNGATLEADKVIYVSNPTWGASLSLSPALASPPAKSLTPGPYRPQPTTRPSSTASA